MSASLARRRILVTRAPEQAAELVAALEAEGAAVELVPMIAFGPPSSWEAADRALGTLERYDAALFTSANAVDRFWTRLEERVGSCDDIVWPARVRVFAVGPKTASALAAKGITPEEVPAAHRGAALGRAAADALAPVAGRRVLLPRAEEGRDEAAAALTAAGALVDIAPVYRTVAPAGARSALEAALARGAFDASIFASPSAVTHAADALGSAARASLARVVAIGPTTAEAAAARGLSAAAVADGATPSDLVAAVVRALSG
ncbi:MAG TPA: uroporphyrinogen-III synthase [bacterium]|nr:uroporphyrinogen-III synthase [bacterium]